MSNILRNAVIFEDNTIIESRHRHDYQCYAGLCVDGGLSYLRRVGKATMGVEDISLTTEDSFEDIRDGFSWGTRGRDGRQPLRYIFLKDMETDHIKAILKTQYQVPEYIREVFYTELEYRGQLFEGERENLDALCGYEREDSDMKGAYLAYLVQATMDDKGESK